MSVGELALKFSLVDVATAGLRSIAKQLEQMEGKAGKLGKVWEKATKDFQTGAKVMMGTKEFWDRGVRPGIEASSDLQTALKKLEAELMTKSTPIAQVREELARLKETATAVGNPLPLDITQIMDAELALKKAGLAVKDIAGPKGAVAASSFLSVLEEMDPGRAATLVGDIGTQFQLTGDSYFDLADQIARAGSASSTGAAEIAESMTEVGSAAKRLGIDYKTTLAILALEAKVGLKGGRAGTALDAVLGSLTTKPTGDVQRMEKKYNVDFFDKKGQFVGLEASITQLKAAESKMTQQQREDFRKKLFGETGSTAAAALLDMEGGYQAILREMEVQLEIDKKIEIRLQGHRAQVDAMKGTWRSIVADGFTPMLDILTASETKFNGILSGAAAFQSKHEGVNTAVSGIAGVGLAGGALFGGYKLLSAALGAGRVAGGLGAGGLTGALMGTATGIAAGKAVEAATGVAPVFVTNWPGGGIAGGAGAVAGVPGAGAMAQMGAAARLAPGAPMGAFLGATGAAGIATTVAGVLSAGAVGYGVGSLIQKGLEITGAADRMQEGLARALGALGSDWGKSIADDFARERERARTDLNLTVNVDKDGRATVTENKGLDDVRIQNRRNGVR